MWMGKSQLARVWGTSCLMVRRARVKLRWLSSKRQATEPTGGRRLLLLRLETGVGVHEGRLALPATPSTWSPFHPGSMARAAMSSKGVLGQSPCSPQAGKLEV